MGEHTCLFFGCWGGTGHYLWTPDARSAESVVHPWGRGHRGLDGTLAPGFRHPRTNDVAPEEQRQGVAAVHHKGGWTALAFWDRSVDERPGSNAVFLIRGDVSAEETARIARESFPRVWARFGFAVILPSDVPG